MKYEVLHIAGFFKRKQIKQIVNLNFAAVGFLCFLFASIGLKAQTLEWALQDNGAGVSHSEYLLAGDFIFGSGLTHTTFSTSGAYAKTWSTGEKDSADYFMVSCISLSDDTLVLQTLSFKERRSGTSVRQMELWASSETTGALDLLHAVLPDNDAERQRLIHPDKLFLAPKDTFCLYFYAYKAEKESGTWRIGAHSLRLQWAIWERDSLPPLLESTQLVNDSLLRLKFNEALDSTSIDRTRFKIEEGLAIASIDKTKANDSLIELHFSASVENRKSYHLQYRLLSDLSANADSLWKRTSFSVSRLEAFDLLITEIMADPSPAVYLPEVEYVELYNNWTDTLNLEGNYLKINKKLFLLPHFRLPPKAYCLLSCNEAQSYYKEKPLIALWSSPNQLPNSSFRLSVLNSEQAWVHQVDFGRLRCLEPDKREGGWSSEMQDFSQPCDMINNWRASTSDKGGTPAAVNTASHLSEEAPLLLLNQFFLDSNRVALVFNRYFTEDLARKKTWFSLEDNTPVAVHYTIGDYRVQLEFETNFALNTIYQLQIHRDLASCSQLLDKESRQKTIARPLKIEPKDLIINEILFSSGEGQTSYVELYNASSKVLDLQELKLQQVENEEAAKPQTSDLLFSEPQLIYPNEYRALTKQRAVVLDYYTPKRPDWVLESASLLNFRATNTYLSLLNRAEQTIDKILYSEDWHSPFLISTKGVALEKIHPQYDALREQSWQSAAAWCLFGTPACENSQYANEVETKDLFSLKSPHFSPDQDAFEDYLYLSYRLKEEACQASVYCFDLEGHKVRTLANNELLGLRGQWIWDGRTDEGTKAPYGKYIITIQLIRPDGTQQLFKKLCSLNVLIH